MKPEILKLYNIGPFVGEHEIDFSQLDDFFLISGKTGSGKSGRIHHPGDDGTAWGTDIAGYFPVDPQRFPAIGPFRRKIGGQFAFRIENRPPVR